MKKRILRVLAGAGVLWLPVALFAQTSVPGENPVYVNTGGMYVAAPAAGATASMLVTQSLVLHGENSAINVAENGIIAIGGSIYQNISSVAAGTLANGFAVDADGKPLGKGTVSFRDVPGIVNTGGIRTISARSGVNSATVANDGFTRANGYVAFPQIEIATTLDTEIQVPPRMGIDALRITQPGTARLRLQSGVADASAGGNVFDASLRLIGTSTDDGTSASRVPAGAVIVERDVSGYREPANLVGGGTGALMPFAAPFENLRSGYFAGNFVRQTSRNAATGHVDYVYANKANSEGIIATEQYITRAQDPFDANRALIINLRPFGFDYGSLSSVREGLQVTNAGAGDYDKGKFEFNGQPYTMAVPAEQVFAQNVLYASPTLSGGNANVINWAIGNSYTAGIDVAKLFAEMNSSGIHFRNQIFVFPTNGAQNYQPLNVDPAANFNILEYYTVIPSQSTFILQVLNRGVAAGSQQPGGQFNVGNSLLSHGDVAHGRARARGNSYLEEVLFRVSPVNSSAYDLTLIGFRDAANNASDNIDLPKMYNADRSVFQLYSTSDDGQMLSGNALSTTTKKANAPLSFRPADVRADYTISTTRLESLTTEVVWLEDLKEGKMVDLRAVGEYTFTANPGDNPNRFIVHFIPSTDGGDVINGIDIAYNGRDREIVVTGLEETDKGSLLVITNAQGRVINNSVITEVPEMRLNVSFLTDGVYIASVKGNSITSKKFVVSPFAR